MSRFAVLLLLALPTGVLQAQETPFQQMQAQYRRTSAVVPQSPSAAIAAAGPMGAGAGPMGSGVLSDAVSSLKSAALGSVKGCNYGKYMAMADQMSKYSGSFSSLFTATKKPSGWGLPVTDYLSLLFTGGTNAAAKKTAEGQQQGLVYQLEQVCNAVVQADHMNRQFEIIKAGSLNMGNAIHFLATKLELRLTKVKGTDKAHLDANWARLYDDVVPPESGAQDSMYRAVSQTLHQSLEKSNQISAALDSLEEKRKMAELELDLLADPDTTGNADHPWHCPVTYPDTIPVVGNPGVRTRSVNGVPIPICGPVGEVRAKQINASLMALDGQANRMRNEADITMLQVDAIKLASENQSRRVQSYNDNRAATHW